MMMSGSMWEIFRGTHDLTDRQLEVVQLLARGKSGKFVADTLGISTNTVRSHRRAIYVKLKVHSHAALLRLVFEYVRMEELAKLAPDDLPQARSRATQK